MKYWYVCLTMGFWKIVDAFKPYINRYRIYTQNACCGLIKSISGYLPQYGNDLLKKVPLSFGFFTPNIQVTTIPGDCDIQTGKCNKEIIIPGYMDHCPKEDAEKRHQKKQF
jgi:hypothetical protein